MLEEEEGMEEGGCTCTAPKMKDLIEVHRTERKSRAAPQRVASQAKRNSMMRERKEGRKEKEGKGGVRDRPRVYATLRMRGRK